MAFHGRKKAGVIALGASATAVAMLIALGVVGIGANAQTAPTGTSSRANSAAVAQVSTMCTSATQQVHKGVASGFMEWFNQKCDTEGASKVTAMADNNSAPMGALICQYAKMRVQEGSASSMDAYTAKSCDDQKTLPLQSGILTQWNPPPFGPPITVTSAWAGTVNGHHETVYAGSQGRTRIDGSAGNPQQGLVVVLDPGANTGAGYPTSALDGPLTIESANGPTLSLSASDGAAYSFNATTSTFTKVG